jgi:prepilin-type N-terminal cleavage/methylation domain-containing protein
MRRRQGFTIVELLVAMALIVFIMAILSEAFVAGLKVFRDLKALGDMNERLRTAATLLTGDLAADHFEGKKRLSDPNFWQHGPPREGFFRIWQIPHPADINAGTIPEGADLDGIPSFRSLNTSLHFTIKKRGNGLQDFLSATVPADSPLLTLALPDSRYQDTPGVYKSQWAEVAWFVKPNGKTAGSSPLYALYRRQLVCVPDNSLNWGPNAPSADKFINYKDEVSCTLSADGTKVFFNSPIDLTIPERRFGMDHRLTVPVKENGGLPDTSDPTNTDFTYPVLGGALAGADLVLTDVLSFDVRVLVNRPAQSTSVPAAWDFYNLNDDPNSLEAIPPFRSYVDTNPPRYRFLGKAVRVFDTWSNVKDEVYDYSNWNVTYNADGTTSYAGPNGPVPGATPTSIPLRRLYSAASRTWSGDIRIYAIKVSIRTWDFKTNQARQITIIQDM